MTRLLCECNSSRCQETIDLDPEDAFRIRQHRVVILANDCRHGPEPTDQLVERREGYSLYREWCARGGDLCGSDCELCHGRHESFTGLDLAGIDWLIVGGESGARHRLIRPGWVRDLRDAARWWHTAFFFKQWGGATPKAGGRELDGRTWDEFPARNPIREETTVG